LPSRVECPAAKPLDDELRGRRSGVLEAEWLKHEIADGAIDGRARHHLDDPPRDAESCVVVAPRLSRRRDLHQVGD